MNKVYVSKPFIIDESTDVMLSPIEVSNKKERNDNLTTGVLLHNNVPAENYIMKIFKVTPSGRQTLIGFTFTDSFGQFSIPLNAKSSEYLVKVYSLKEELESISLRIN